MEGELKVTDEKSELTADAKFLRTKKVEDAAIGAAIAGGSAASAAELWRRARQRQER